MRFLLFCLTFLFLICAAPNPERPALSDHFKADVQVQYPYVPMVSGEMYYDFSRLRIRMELELRAAHTMQFLFYSQSIKFIVSHGQCTNDTLEEDIPPLGILPIGSVYLYTEEVRPGIRTEVWQFDFGSMGGVATWYVLRNPQVGNLSTLIRTELRTGDFTTRLDFFNYTTEPAPETIWDASAYGCPVPPPPEHFHVMGMVRDAQNDDPLPFSVVYLESPVFTNMIAADEYGLFQFDEVPAYDNYTLRALSVGYNEARYYIGVDHDIPPGTIADIYMNRIIHEETNFRFILAWGEKPDDLDAHLLTPYNCHVYYNNRICASPKGGNSSLDADSRHGYGPETISVRDPNHEGAYLFFVRSYQHDAWDVSHAQVQIYGSEQVVKTILVTEAHRTPGARAYYWKVASVQTQPSGPIVITVINEIVDKIPTVQHFDTKV